jgi:uncharacterized protein YkwD
VYGWNDPIDPDGAPRRPEPPTDEPPAWLTDRPEPRSSYLFGDQPEQPGDEWHGDRSTERWHPTYDAPTTVGQPLHPTPERPFEPTGGLPFAPPAGPAYEPGDRFAGPAYGPDDRFVPAFGSAAGPQPADVTAPLAAVREGRHRAGRRLPRGLLIGGAAAAATLVASLGVGAMVLSGGNDRNVDPTSVDDTVAAAPALPGTGTAADPLAGSVTAAPSPSATPSPTSARPTPSPSLSRKPTPKPTRTSAASRGLIRGTAPAGSGTKPTVTGVSSQAQQVVDLVNAERAKAGCGALKINSKLMTAAQRHSQDQADHQNMTHDGSDGSDAGDRLDRVGYAWRSYGENVAWNQKTPAAVMDAWMNSPGHRANILNCGFTEIGVGIATSNGPYWTQDFGTPR